MTNAQKIAIAALITKENAAEYAATDDKFIFAQDLIEEITYPRRATDAQIEKLENAFDKMNAAPAKKLYIVKTLAGDTLSIRNSETFARADAAKSSFDCVITVCEVVETIVC